MYVLLSTNLINIGFAMGLLAIAYLSNMCFSLYYNIKIVEESFNWTKLFNGILKLIAVCIGIAALSCVITLLPLYLQYVGIALAEEFIDTFNILAVITLFVNSIYKYSKEAYETLKNILSPENFKKNNNLGE